ncbi:MAG: hypothetical protein D6732_05045 [Methanobacteriota archaeon]|nr:MAG: hypothetical protein D6732_05045 [Euryarchaeota archaeon]
MKIMVKIGKYEVNLDYYYYDTYIWINRESDNEVEIGLTDYGQQELKDIIDIELPQKSQRFAEGTPFIKIESISKDYVLKSPMSLVVNEVNFAVADNPEILNEKPFQTWIVRAEVLDLSDFDKLMDGDDMADLIADEVGETAEELSFDEDADFDYENDLNFDSGDDYYSEYDDEFFLYDDDDY